ncbi:polyphosphate kinase 2 [Zhongshania sp. BJYM1]|uniref:polyphosphate kinase 2 n=1 Tax=Zhongshania aquatica TaxID=2965069 RepID=UPI0022B45B8C|nr:polyphosphate kinase 2 [Marortus sp. BJYM1]
MKKEQKTHLHELYIELVKCQKEIITSGLKLVLILEGRDAAGKDGSIKKIIKHLSPRETRVVALNKPSDTETHQWYFQRYAAHLPAEGEFVIFNRSWYNRAGVENVMEFCTNEQYEKFFTDVELFEKMLINANTIVLKYYLDISKQEQKRRLDDRKNNPLTQWKISPIDLVAQKMWEKYSEARNSMLQKTSFDCSPWYIANAEDKDTLHIAIITHLLNQLDYENKNEDLLAIDAKLIFAATEHNIKNKLFQ